MQIDFDQELVGYDGVSINESEENPTPTTLARACARALAMVPAADGVKKMEQFRLAEKVFAGGNVNLSPPEITLVMDVSGKFYTPGIVGPIYRLLDPPTEN